jgi:Skp family chaperone for outer membrane proteins
MRSAKLLVVMAAVGALALLTAVPSLAAVKVGVVDIAEVTNQYERTKDANLNLTAEQEKLKTAAEEKVKALNTLKTKRDSLTRDSAEWKKANEDLMKGMADYQGWLAFEQAKIEVKHRDLLLDMYHQVAAATAAQAKAKSLDLVFTKAFLAPPQIDLDQAVGLEDLKGRILNQRIVWPTMGEKGEIIDITADVIKVLNADYAKAKAAPVVAPK